MNLSSAKRFVFNVRARTRFADANRVAEWKATTLSRLLSAPLLKVWLLVVEWKTH